MKDLYARLLPPIVTILLAGFTLAASWGITKSEVADLSKDVAALSEGLESNKNKMTDLEIAHARDGQILLNIQDTLIEMKSDIKDIKHGKH